MQNPNYIPIHQTTGLSFSIYSKEEVLKMSVLEVTNPQTFDVLGHPMANGVYDARFGTSEMKSACVTCDSPSSACSGHFGHIVLPVPVFNPIFIKTTYQLVKGTCLRCYCIVVPRQLTVLTLYQLKALNHGLLVLAMDMEETANEIVSKAEVMNVQTETILKTRLDKMLSDALRENGKVNDETSKMDVMVKSIVDYRNRVINTYLRASYEKQVKCRNCHCKRREMFLDMNARIVLGVRGASINKMDETKKKKTTKKKPKKKDKGKEDDDDDDDQEDFGFGGIQEVEEENKDDFEPMTQENQVYMCPAEVREHLLKVYANNRVIIDHLFGSLVDTKNKSSDVTPIDGFFLDVLPVPPARFRPLATLNSEKFNNPHSAILSSVIQDCIDMKHVMLAVQRDEQEFTTELKELLTKVRGETPLEMMQHLWFTLQVRINSIYDSNMDKINRNGIGGVKQVLEKKDGLFRMFMMGKRVNYAARSVISPDPYINIDEIGIPDVFATKLTYPQPVTRWNVEEMRQAILNGPNIHPGAVMVQNEDGKTVLLSKNINQREGIANQLLTPKLEKEIKRCKIVYRHLQNGDVLLLNRQPTLHKPSIMAHKAYILSGEKTLRLHYSNCKTYNADFDGDEMNAHFPQGEVARSEAYGIASVNHQYLVPKDGTPLGGLIQDHIIASVLLMIRGKFFNRVDYQQLVFGALTKKNERIQLLHPSILRPCVLWSGKQVVSTVIINTIPSGSHLLSLVGKSKIPLKSWQNEAPRDWLAGGTKLKDLSMTESEVIIRNGEILCGILDKAHSGPTPFGLIHCCYELYGGEVSGLLLSHLGRLFAHFLQIEGFTLGIKDILVTSKADKKRLRLMRKARKVGVSAVCDALNIDEKSVDEATLKQKMAAAHLSPDGSLMKQLDLSMKLRTDDFNNKINKVCIPDGLLKRFPDNNLQLMVLSGAKGATVNCIQISCMLGQIELEGCRPRPMQSGKTLPSFVAYDPSPRAGGFVDGRFLTGIRPQEYFFHCMAGREGLIDTAVKTSRSGYLQRCLIKHMEGVNVGYDMTVRDSDGSIIQFQYGEDSLDITKIPFLLKEQLGFLIENVNSNQLNEKEVSLANGDEYQKILKETKKVRKLLKKIKKESERVGSSGIRPRTGSYLNFSVKHLEEVKDEFPGVNPDTHREYAVEKLMEMWNNLDETEKSSYKRKPCPDPISTRYCLGTTLGAISERMDNVIESYLNEVPIDYKMKRNDVRTMLHHKVMKSVCEPGEAVGLLAAQSIGEPSTQMTLNTFHFAGRGEMNVTLGIPRLREILMTASANISTPSLEVPFLPNVSKLEKKAEILKQKLTKVFLSEVLEKVSVKESISIKMKLQKRVYKIRFHLLPYKFYEEELYVNPSKILFFIEHIFLKYFITVAHKKTVLMQKSSLVSNAAMRETRGAATKGVKDDENEKDNTEKENVGDEELPPTGGNRNDDDSSDDEQEEGDGDGGTEKQKERHNQEREYDEEANDAELSENEDEDDEDLLNDSKLEEEEEDASNGLDLMEDAVNVSTLLKKRTKKRTQISQVEVKSRIQYVLGQSSFLTDYSFDAINEEWCEATIQVDLCAKRLDMITLITEEAKKSVVHHTPGINRAFIVDNMDAQGNKQKVLKTDGINIQEIFKYDKLLDLQKLYCNDIHAMANTYGIEAAFRVIVKEVQNVFKVYGIEINPRHLLLTADYMTFNGIYKAFNRKCFEICASPLQQMTFESTTHFLQQATFKGFKDGIKSPSARLIVGKLVGCGTGSFSLMHPVS